jgi:hypothetical protein
VTVLCGISWTTAATAFAPPSARIEFVNRELQAAGEASQHSIAEEPIEAGISVALG